MATFAELITKKEGELAAKRALILSATTERKALIGALSASDSLDDTSQARFDSLGEEKRSAEAVVPTLETELTELRKEADDDEKATRAAATSIPAAQRQYGDGTQGKSERTYRPDNDYDGVGGASFFRDMFLGQYNGDSGAGERIQRHMQEARTAGELSKRAGTTTGFVGLVPPQYLVDQAAVLARAGRPTANVVQHFQLPSEGMALIIPRGTTGVSEAIQATENATVSNTDEVWANLTVPVVTIAGQQVISRQSVERGAGIDQLIFNDLTQAYNVALDTQVLSGTGSSGQMLGILNTAGIGQATAFGAAATIATLYTKLTGALNSVETGRFLAPDVIIMHPRRWNWLLGQLDASNRPLVVPNMNGPFNAVGVAEGPMDTALATPVGWMLGVPIITDANIPTAVGTGPEDQIIVARKEDLLLWENGDGAPFQLRFEQPYGSSLGVQLIAYNYAAFTAGRYPLATAVVGGNAGTSGFGLVAPTF